jgi:hypothetical protein
MSSFASRNCSWNLVGALGLGLLLAGAANAAAPPSKGDSTLDRANKLTSVAAQKAEAEVRSAVLAAQQAKSPEKAADILKRALTKLEDNTAVTEARKKALTRMLEGRIKAYEAGADKDALSEKDVDALIRKFENKQISEKKQEENAELRKGLNEVLELQQKGKQDEARARSKELARKFPGSPAAVATYSTMSAMDQLVSARMTRNDKASGFQRGIRDVEKSSIIPKDDITFPADWAEKTKRRAGKYGPVKLSPKEQAIVRALSTPTTVTFKGERFQDVIEYLATVTNQPILLDKQALADAQVDYDSPVNLSVKNVTVRTILRKILAEFGLTYIVKDETIQVVSIAKARETMTVRAYPVGDLLGVGGGPGDPLTNFFGPGIGQVQRMQNIANLIGMIQNSVDPSSWQINGGPGTIAFDFGSMSIVIKNSAEVHAMLGGLR